jgi:hypothetical protein
VLSIGSGVEAAWRFRLPELQRLHALVTNDPSGHASVMRAGPDADVLLNGTLIGPDPHRLAPGDVIHVGTLDFTYVIDAPPEDATGTGHGYLRDARRERIHALARDASTIGRETTSDIVLQEPEVARLHARIEREGDAVRVLPQPGAVTLLNGSRVERSTTLKDGDAIGIGRTVLFFTHGPPRRHPLENTANINMERYTRRLGTGVLGVVVRREEREEQERRRTRRTMAALVVVLALVAGGFAIWRSSVVSAWVTTLLARLG